MWSCCNYENYGTDYNLQHHDFAHYSQDHIQCFQPPTFPTEKYMDVTNTYDVNNHHHCQYYYENNTNHVLDQSVNDYPCHLNHWDNMGTCPPQCEDRLPEVQEPDKKKILKEIHEECEHLLAKDDCVSCHIKFSDTPGDVQTIPLSKLVNIVLMTAGASLEDVSTALCRKREQNKEAAAKYRDRQKAKWQKMSEEKSKLEERNAKLKDMVSSLEKEVTLLRQKFLDR